MQLPTFEQAYSDGHGGFFVSIQANGTWVPGLVTSYGKFFLNPEFVDSYQRAVRPAHCAAEWS